MSAPMKPLDRSRWTFVSALVVRFVMLLALWWVLAEGETYQAWFGLAVAAIAAGVSLSLVPPMGKGVRILPALQFVPLFLWLSMLGGVDVARRVIRRKLTIEPAFVKLPLHTGRGPARLWLVATISLMPGTLSCHLEEHYIEIHVLDRSMNAEQVVRRLESYLARIFHGSTSSH